METSSATSTSDAEPESVVLLKEIRDLLKKQEQPLLTAHQVCEFLGIHIRTLSRHENAGTFPAGVESPGGVRWRRQDIINWANNLKPRTKKGRRFKVKIASAMA